MDKARMNEARMNETQAQANTSTASSTSSASSQRSTPSPLAPAKPQPTTTNWKLIAGLVGGGLMMLAVILGIVFLLTRNPQLTANLRDVAIIIFATVGLLVMIVLGALMIVLVYYMQSLVALLRNEIKPVLTNVNQTVNTVRGTTTMVGDNIAKPIVKAASFLAGMQAAGKAFTARTTKVDNKTRD
jgi:hypothetical protein